MSLVVDMGTLSPLPPTAATLLRVNNGDGRSALTVIASDMMVSKAVCEISDFLGFEPNIPHLIQTCGSQAVSQLAIVLDLWISGSKTQSKVISSTQLSLGSLVVGCLAPMAIEQSIYDIRPELQMRCAALGICSTMVYSLIARQWPEDFDRAATIAQFRKVPIADAYRHVCGESIRATGAKLSDAWKLPRELRLALAGPAGSLLSIDERTIVTSIDIATQAAQSAGVSVEPWPHTVNVTSIEQMALIQAMGMRAKRVAASLEKKLERLRSA